VEAPGAVHLVKVGLGEEELRLATEVDVALSPAAVATATAPTAATAVTAATGTAGTAGTAASTLRGGRGAATAHCGNVSRCTSIKGGSQSGVGVLLLEFQLLQSGSGERGVWGRHCW
jgi:hypothetical protein